MLITLARPHIRAQELYRENVMQELLDRHPPRFRKLMGQHINFGWKEEGPQNEETAYLIGRRSFD